MVHDSFRIQISVISAMILMHGAAWRALCVLSLSFREHLSSSLISPYMHACMCHSGRNAFAFCLHNKSLRSNNPAAHRTAQGNIIPLSLTLSLWLDCTLHSDVSFSLLLTEDYSPLKPPPWDCWLLFSPNAAGSTRHCDAPS